MVKNHQHEMKSNGTKKTARQKKQAQRPLVVLNNKRGQWATQTAMDKYRLKRQIAKRATDKERAKTRNERKADENIGFLEVLGFLLTPTHSPQPISTPYCCLKRATAGFKGCVGMRAAEKPTQTLVGLIFGVAHTQRSNGQALGK